MLKKFIYLVLQCNKASFPRTNNNTIFKFEYVLLTLYYSQGKNMYRTTSIIWCILALAMLFVDVKVGEKFYDKNNDKQK